MERELRNWTRVELAQLLGSSSKTIARWERGESFPQPHFHQKLCLLLNTSFEALGLETRNSEIKKQRLRRQRHQTEVELSRYGYHAQEKGFQPRLYSFPIRGWYECNTDHEYIHNYDLKTYLALHCYYLNKCFVSSRPSLVSLFQSQKIILEYAENDTVYYGSSLLAALRHSFFECTMGSVIYFSSPTGAGKSSNCILLMKLEAIQKCQLQNVQSIQSIQSVFAKNVSTRVKNCNSLDIASYSRGDAIIDLSMYCKKSISNTIQSSILYLSCKENTISLQLGMAAQESRELFILVSPRSYERFDAHATNQRSLQRAKPVARGDGKIPMYQIARNLAGMHQYVTVSSILWLFISNFSTDHPWLQTGRLVYVMQHIVQEVLQVLSHPAWQGVGSLLTLIGIVISLLPRRTSPDRQSAKKNPMNSYSYFCPTLLA